MVTGAVYCFREQQLSMWFFVCVKKTYFAGLSYPVTAHYRAVFSTRIFIIKRGTYYITTFWSEWVRDGGTRKLFHNRLDKTETELPLYTASSRSACHVTGGHVGIIVSKCLPVCMCLFGSKNVINNTRRITVERSRLITARLWNDWNYCEKSVRERGW